MIVVPNIKILDHNQSDQMAKWTKIYPKLRHFAQSSHDAKTDHNKLAKMKQL